MENTSSKIHVAQPVLENVAKLCGDLGWQGSTLLLRQGRFARDG